MSFCTSKLRDLTKTTIPPRSRLHHLNPVGLGSAFVESLTGYVARLADSHSMPAGVLMEQELAPILEKTYLGDFHRLYERTGAFNGVGAMASNICVVLESLTGCNSLKFLTMLTWSGVLPSRHLTRSTKAWCSECYRDWKAAGKIVYEPLLWSLQAVKLCSYHKKRLTQECPYCHKHNFPISWWSRPGYCSECLRWLGASESMNIELAPEDELKWLFWSANTIGEAMTTAPHLLTPLNKEQIAQSLKKYASLTTDGNIAEFSRRVKIPRNTVWLWFNGRNQPHLEALLKVCYCLDTSLVGFLIGEPTICSSVIMRTAVDLPSNPRAEAKKIQLEQLEQNLQSILLNHSCPPPSMSEVAKYLGYDCRTISRHFKDLCHAISLKYMSYRKAIRLRSIEQTCEEVRLAVASLHKQGMVPSEERIAKLISRPGDLRRKVVRDFLHRARHGLGI